MFQAKVKSETLKGIVDVVSTLVDEAKFNVNAKGVSLKAVDPAHVAMVDLKIDKSAFEEFAADDTELGIDLDKIKAPGLIVFGEHERLRTRIDRSRKRR